MSSFLRSLFLLPLILWAAVFAHAAEPKTGSILCQYWRETPGTAVEDLTSLPTYPNMPIEQVYLDRFEIPENQEGDFGTVIKGFIYPPMDGSYTFYIASTNEGQLWLGESSIQLETANTMVAHVPQWCAPRDWSACKTQAVELKKGVPFYVEARHKNGGGDNHLAIAWKLPDGTMEGPIPGSRFSPGTPAIVPAPKAYVPLLPEQAGIHRVDVHVAYLDQRLIVPVTVDIPQTYRHRRACPGIVHIPDPDAAFDLHAAIPPEIRSDYHVVVITPGLPEGRSYDQRVTRACVAAAVKAICSSLGVDHQHLGLTGAAAGGTAAWRIALELPETFSGFSPVNALQVEDPRLKQNLKGTKVRIYTDVDEGFATGRANAMHAALEGNDPKPEIVYLGQKELTGQSAAQYCYSRPDFFMQLLSLTPASAGQEGPLGLGSIIGVSLAAAVLAFIFWRLWRRTAD